MIPKVLLYVVAISVPLIISVLIGGTDYDPKLAVMALRFGLLGITIMSLQFVLASRARWIERGVGLDTIFRLHRAMGVLAVALVTAHPLLIAAAFGRWDLLTTFSQSPAVLVGKASLAFMLVLGISSVYRLSLGIEFQTWRQSHNLLAVIALSFAGYHMWFLGQARTFPAFRAVPVALLLTAAAGYAYTKWIAPRRAARSPYEVVRVSPEAGRVTTLELAPTGTRIEPHLPGQFAFIKFQRGSEVTSEEHPFTIASAPSPDGHLSFTIKSSGDFTASVDRAKPGDLVAVQGPFGIFSRTFHPEETRLVFIAGGIGITPLMSMIRAMHTSSTAPEVLLIYGNETEGEIVFREELEAVAASGRPSLRVLHVLRKPEESWLGDRGVVTRDLIVRECGADLVEKAYYICGPPVMMDKVIDVLRGLGVPRRHVHWEEFSL